jgi:hypothetical protein
MKTKITQMKEEIIKEENGIRTEHRKTEITMEIEGALEAIAIRIDKGYDFEVRAEPSKPAGTNPEPSSGQIKQEERLRQIKDGQAALNFIRTDGEPILSLPGKLPVEESENDTEIPV